MSQTIELKDSVFTKLKQSAERRGVTPELWIEMRIEQDVNADDKIFSDVKNQKFWSDFIGAAENLPSPKKKAARTTFGKIAAKKLKNQGLKLNYDAD